MLLGKDGRIQQCKLDQGDETEQLKTPMGMIRDVCTIPKTFDISSQHLTDPDTDDLLLVMEDGVAQVVDPIDLNQVRRVRGGRDQTQSLAPGGSLEPFFQLCASGLGHIVLVDQVGQVWSAGCRIQSGHFQQPDAANLGIRATDDLIVSRIDFFQGFRVTSICAGLDFTVVIVKRCDDDQDLEDCIDKGSRSSSRASRTARGTSSVCNLIVKKNSRYR